MSIHSLTTGEDRMVQEVEGEDQILIVDDGLVDGVLVSGGVER